MDRKAVLKELCSFGEDLPLPRQALKEVMEQKEEFAPIFLKLMKSIFRKYESGETCSEQERNLNTCGMFLLAEMREKRAFPLLLKLSSLDSRALDDIFGELLTESLGNLLYSTFNGDSASAMDFVADEDHDPVARAAVLSCLSQLLLDGEFNRDEFVRFARDLLKETLRSIPSPADEEKAEDEDEDEVADGPTTFLNYFLTIITQAHLYELIEDVRDFFNDGDGDGSLLAFPSILDAIFDCRERSAKIITSAADEVCRLGAFKKDDKPAPEPAEPLKEEAEPEPELEPDVIPADDPRIVLTYNVGRNDPCPCGSGKKFKKCCLPKKQELQASMSVSARPSRSLPAVPYPRLHSDDGFPGLLDCYSEDAVAVDRPAYTGVQYLLKAVDESARSDDLFTAAEDSLWTAFLKYQEVCAAKDLHTPEEFDREHIIHYPSRIWLEMLKTFLSAQKSPRIWRVRAALGS